MVEIIKDIHEQESVHDPIENTANPATHETVEKSLDGSIENAAKALAGIEDEKNLSEKTVSKANLLKRIMQKLGHHISNPLEK